MGRAIFSCLRQSLGSVRFWLGAALTVLALLFASMDAGTKALRSEAALEAGFHGQLLLDALRSDAMTVCLPMVCALPYAAGYVEDVKTGFIKSYIYRSGIRGYILGKEAGCMVSGGGVIVVGVWLAYALSAAVFFPLEGPPDPDIETPAYAMMLLRNCGLLFWPGGFGRCSA